MKNQLHAGFLANPQSGVDYQNIYKHLPIFLLWEEKERKKNDMLFSQLTVIV
jgi:hypothetical protein